MTFTTEELQRAIGCTNAIARKWVQPINAACNEFEINNNSRLAAFIASIAHESTLLTQIEENLNYKAEQLVRVWPSRFKTLEFAQQFHKQPQKIANYVYANRMGNGGPESGDGWRYRGMGLKQLTGKDNQFAAALHFCIDPEAIGAWLLTPEGAARSAGWFWAENGCNGLADRNNFQGCCAVVNVGNANASPTKIIGLQERMNLWAQCKKVWK